MPLLIDSETSSEWQLWEMFCHCNDYAIAEPSTRTQFVAKSKDFDKQMQVRNDEN